MKGLIKLLAFLSLSAAFLGQVRPSAQTAGQQAIAPEQRDFFENHFRPVLANHCYTCHTASRLGGLSLPSREDVLRGGQSGSAIVPGDPEKSLLIHAIRA